LTGLDLANNTKELKAIVLEINSYSGSLVASEEIANKIKDIEKPIISFIRCASNSRLYWIASAKDMIFASKLSNVGSIRVTISYIDESKLNEKTGYTWNSLSMGKFKYSGSEHKALTKDERILFERDLKIIYDEFVKSISINWGFCIEKAVSLADGSTMQGELALQNGLIDEIGSLKEVEVYLEKNLCVKPEIC